MRIPFNIATQVVNTVHRIINNQLSAQRLIQHQSRVNRKWGARDRRIFADQCYTLIRYLRRWYYIAEGHTGDLAHITFDHAKVWSCWAAMLHSEADNSEHHLPDFETIAHCDVNAFADRMYNLLKLPAINTSVPDWMYQILLDQYTTDAESLLASLNRTAPLFIRVNRRNASKQEVCARLNQAKIAFTTHSANAIEIIDRKHQLIAQLVDKGMVEIQDLSSQLVAPMVNPQPHEHIIDACAGAGGKTLHIADLLASGGRITAMDNSCKRLERLQSRAERNSINNIDVKVINHDVDIAPYNEKADTLLLDVPCSGSGVWRRKPETKWFVDEGQFHRLVLTQSKLLSQYSSMVRPGGYLIYSTCSVFAQENRLQVDHFIEKSARNWLLEEEKAILPIQDGGDGFYIARLRNSPE